MRICHLEDLIFENGVDVNAVLKGIEEKKFPLSLKYDGNPSFVVGKDAKGSWIAFKNGYLKKEPELYHSPQEVYDRIKDRSLATKMALLLLVFHDSEPLLKGHTLGGDLMFCGDMDRNNRTFQANTVRYAYLGGREDVTLGVAMHTRDGKPYNYRDDWMEKTFHMVMFDTMPGISYRADFRPDVDNTDGLTSAQKDAFKKWVNSCVRNGHFDLYLDDFYDHAQNDKMKRHIGTYATEWQRVISYYKEIARFKDRVLDSVHYISDIVPEKGEFDEGIVVDTGDRLIKLVDRIKFSARNFNRER
jgi:hypothetical protein